MMGFRGNNPGMGAQNMGAPPRVSPMWNMSPTSPPLQSQAPFRPTQMPYEQAETIARLAGTVPPPGQTPTQAFMDYMTMKGSPIQIQPQRNDAITPPSSPAPVQGGGTLGMPMAPGALANTGGVAYGTPVAGAGTGFGGGYGGLGFGAPSGFVAPYGFSPSNYLMSGTAAMIPGFNPTMSAGNLYPDNPIWSF